MEFDPIDPNEIEEWCEDSLPELYNPGMFDDEKESIAVWDAFNVLIYSTILDYIENAKERDSLAEDLYEAAEDWFRSHHTEILEMIPVEEPHELLSRPQIIQHSEEWYRNRYESLTASEFSQILDGRRGALMRSKLRGVVDGGPSFSSKPIAIAYPDGGDMTATLWGHRFEPLTRAIYELEIAGVGTVNDSLGRFQHKTIPWLSASPDGVVLSGSCAGRLVEIKSPKSRQPGEFVPYDYYVQMQIQMEVCDRETVDFIEAQFSQQPLFHYAMGGWFNTYELRKEEIDAELKNAKWMGYIEVYGKDAYTSDSWCYRYSEPVDCVEDLSSAKFLTEKPSSYGDEDELVLLEKTLWWLTGFYHRTVLRNDAWWEETGKPAASKFWEEFQIEKEKPVSFSHIDDSTLFTSGKSAFRTQSRIISVLKEESTLDENENESDGDTN